MVVGDKDLLSFILLIKLIGQISWKTWKSHCVPLQNLSQQIVVSDHQDNRALRLLTLAHPALQALE